MGKGLGVGQGTGKGVKGCWRVNVFLLLLTGWQAVLLPWSPLILRDAGFSATSVGVLSGGTTIAATVGVVVCLRAMRRSRSGAVRRLLLWLLLATAILLQGCGVGFELHHLSQGGVMLSCVNGWLFAPAPSVLVLDNVSTSTTPHFPKIVSTELTHGLPLVSIIPSSPSPPQPAVNLHPQHTTPHRPASGSYTSTTTVTPPPSTSPVRAATSPSPAPPSPPPAPPSPPPAPPSPPITTATTTATAATTTSIAITTSLHHKVPAVKISTKKYNKKVPLNNKFSSMRTLTFGNDDATEAAHRKFPAAHKPAIPTSGEGSRKHHYANVHLPDVSSTNSEQGKNLRKPKHHTNHKHIQLPNDDDYQHDLENNDSTSLQNVNEYEDPEESIEEFDNDDNSRKIPDYYQRSASFSLSSFDKLPHFLGNTRSKLSKPTFLLGTQSSSLRRNMQPKDSSSLWESNLQQTPKIGDSFHKLYNTDSFTTKSKQEKGHTLLLSDQKSLPSISNKPWHHPFKPPLLSMTKTHHLSDIIRDLSDSKSQYQDDGSNNIDSRHIIHGRSLRGLTKPGSSHGHPVNIAAMENKSQPNDAPRNKEKSIEDMKSDTVKVLVAVLLVFGGLAGAGIEASVAQLWHCIVHGYDESGLSHDVLQRTISHTFHLSTYGSHKTWTGITSGGWTMVAGVVSVMVCLAGIGGGGYGGLLGVHLVLGVAALLFLLVLPVPYGSIDPPRTRRPLSLYLDDEVLREGVRRLTFHVWVFITGCLAALSFTFSLWLLQEMSAEGWLVATQAGAVGMTLVCESLALHTHRRLVIRWGLHGLMGVCGVSLMLHYGFMWASKSSAVVVTAHSGLGVAMAFLWVAVKHNALLLATVSDQEREAWASWWCWRVGLGIGAAMWGAGLSGSDGRVQPLVLLATIAAAILASSLCMTAVLSSRNSRTRRRVYHTLDLDIANDEVDEEENDATEDDWLVKRAKKEGLTL